MLLQLTQNVLLQDAEYTERIKRHYHEFREKIDGPSPNESQLRNRRILSPRTAVPLDTGTGYMNEFTDEHLDVLQNLEFAIVTTYKQRPEMTDYDVMRIMETLIDGYQAETIGRPPRYTPVTDVEIDLMDNLRRMCEWRLGRIQFVKDEGTWTSWSRTLDEPEAHDHRNVSCPPDRVRGCAPHGGHLRA